MNRRTLPAAAALATAAALLLTACGGSDDGKSKNSGKIAGADEGATKAASPRASASATPGRPKIELPADLSYTFDWPKTGDKDKDAVLSDGEQFVKATDLAVANQDPLDKAYRFYSEGEMSSGTQKYVQGYVDSNMRTTGKYRFYNPSVLINKDGTAAFAYCEDQGKAFGLHIKTKKIDHTPVTSKSYVLYNTALRKNELGVWVTTKMITLRGNSKCQP
ncbi:hypothetical protein OG709_21030 [Streptomyces sp. NBC_01267]|uniref:hypothetical protein n=1 Tax=unclassified Streptomyces TaxID=2593676 RepID=UPI002024FF07|nr:MULTISPECIES: hypothetical protein [unclassified Streptomyces]